MIRNIILLGLTSLVLAGEPDVFGNYFDDSIKEVDISLDVAIKACLQNGNTFADKVKAAYTKCFGSGYDFDDLAADSDSKDSDNDGLSDKFEGNEACFYEEMGWVAGSTVKDGVIKADLVGLEDSLKTEFDDNIDKCASWTGSFGTRRKRDAIETETDEEVPTVMEKGSASLGWLKSAVRKIRSADPGNGNGRGKGKGEGKQKGKGKGKGKGGRRRNGGKRTSKKKGGNNKKKGGGRRNKNKNGNGNGKGKGGRKGNGNKPTKTRKNKNKKKSGGRRNKNKNGNGNAKGKGKGGRKGNGNKPTKTRKNKNKKKSGGRRNKNKNGNGNGKGNGGRKGSGTKSTKKKNGKNKNNKGSARKGKNKDEEGNKGKGKGGNGGKGKNGGKGGNGENAGQGRNKGLDESTYNKLWCFDLSVEQVLEKCVENKIKN